MKFFSLCKNLSNLRKYISVIIDDFHILVSNIFDRFV